MPSQCFRHLFAISAALTVVVVGAGCRILPGQTYRGAGTFYGDSPREGNCMYEDVQGWQYAAMNELDYETARACGAYVRVAGPDGSIVVRIVDRCPECAPGDIDLSPQAFDAIADPADGRVPISWQLVSPSSVGTVGFKVKEGSNPWWFAIQPRNHRNIVVRLEVQVGGRWVALPRYVYNYFVAEEGLGSGPFTVRITDVHGEQLVQSGITLSPGAVQSTRLQFTDR